MASIVSNNDSNVLENARGASVSGISGVGGFCDVSGDGGV